MTDGLLHGCVAHATAIEFGPGRLNQVPPDINPETGQRLQMQGPNEQMIIVEVTEVTDESITLDANPPLAGKDLIFDIELVEIT